MAAFVAFGTLAVDIAALLIDVALNSKRDKVPYLFDSLVQVSCQIP